MEILRKHNVVQIKGRSTKDISFLRPLLACLHQAIIDKGYQDIELDFSRCDGIHPAGMLAVCMQAMKYRDQGVSFALVSPIKDSLRRLFVNVGWSKLISPYEPESRFRGISRVPATVFFTPEDQFSLVNRMMDALLESIKWRQRGDLAALEWAINEVTDNVLVHANSKVGGVAQLSVFPASNKVQVDVCDAGVSIPYTFNLGFDKDPDALLMAVKEGVKGQHSTGKGNGLFGSIQICEKSGGEFHIYSRHGHLMLVRRRGKETGIRAINERVPFEGTLVSMKIDCSKPNILSEALRLEGKVYSPDSFVDFKYDKASHIYFRVIEEAASWGSRAAGLPVRRKIRNLMEMNPGKVVLLDFSGISIISSSFADEVLGKLFSEIGQEKFKKTVKIINANDLVGLLIEREIRQYN
ncbi:DUF4325 domain-containing protein [Candidatus Parcubacteria bacterium]|nr:MAG: DUF4325 domain-containing protein [Candidatus Parcubacteria bacterium]